MGQADGDFVMIVEDDRDTRDALREVLTQFGYETVGAENGRAALEMLRAQSARRPCLIVLDLWMPEMDGWQFSAQQRADPVLRDIPVIIVTADSQAERRAAELRSVAFLAKPVSVPRLVAAVKAHC